ncbi:MAG: hypothetical protein RLP44_28305 [Aggregatilineales bacterium]
MTVALEPLVPLSSKQQRLGDAIHANLIHVEGDDIARADLLAWVDG